MLDIVLEWMMSWEEVDMAGGKSTREVRLILFLPDAHNGNRVTDEPLDKGVDQTSTVSRSDKCGNPETA